METESNGRNVIKDEDNIVRHSVNDNCNQPVFPTTIVVNLENNVTSHGGFSENSHTHIKSERLNEPVNGMCCDSGELLPIKKERDDKSLDVNDGKTISSDTESCNSDKDGKEKTFVCLECGQIFSDDSELKLHQKDHVRILDDSFICVECGEVFSENVKLQIHKVTMHKLKDTVLRTTNTDGKKRGRKPNIKREVTNTDHYCEICDRYFEKRSYLLLHQRLHTGERPYKCSICSKDFRLIGHITSHMTTHLQDRPHDCPVCHKKFARGDYMKKHMKVHTGEKPFECSVCGKLFTLKTNLERHMISHTKEKRYTCNDCGEKFSWEKTLINHIRKCHSDESSNLPYECSVCHQSFGFKKYLERHMKIHTEPLECSTCQMVFKMKSEFNRHMKKHDPKFNCDLCNTTFNLKANKDRHRRNMQFCNICDKNFCGKTTFSAHLREIHSELYETL